MKSNLNERCDNRGYFTFIFEFIGRGAMGAGARRQGGGRLKSELEGFGGFGRARGHVSNRTLRAGLGEDHRATMTRLVFRSANCSSTRRHVFKVQALYAMDCSNCGRTFDTMVYVDSGLDFLGGGGGYPQTC